MKSQFIFITYFIVSRGNVSFMLEITWLTGLNFSPTGDQEGAILNPALGSSFTNLFYFNNKANKASWRNHGRGRKQIPHFYWDKETGWWTDKKDAQGWVSFFVVFFFFSLWASEQLMISPFWPQCAERQWNSSLLMLLVPLIRGYI